MSLPSSLSDVVVAGAGIAGATLALSLKRALGDALRVSLVDPALAEPAGRVPSYRVLAVASDARRVLDALDIWPAMAAEAQPIHSMVITDSRPGAQPNPVFLTFEEPAEGGEPLAYMILADGLRARLVEACAAAGVTFVPAAVTDFSAAPHALHLTFGDGSRAKASLLVAADGARSRLRHIARIQTVGDTYAQSAIVATLGHQYDHRGAALQHFMPAGPIALLPLKATDGTGRRTSIVWTESHAEAARLAGLAAADFIAAFEERVGLGLGAIALEDRPRLYPLHVALARRMTAQRFALMGDAARTIHPLAGQGLNLGLRDAAALAKRIVDHCALGLDPGSAAVLQAYEQDRRLPSVAMAAATDGLNRLFSTDQGTVRTLRDIGLGLVDRSLMAKSQFIGQATGRDAPPRRVPRAIRRNLSD